MVDGLGIPPEGWEKSCLHELCGETFVNLFAENSIPLDACLGIPGLPQSATGQSSLFTGINAAELMGAHLQGFPGPELRKLIRKRNLLASLKAKNKSVVFANAYVRYGLAELAKVGYRSVTTVMADDAVGDVLDKSDLIARRAVYHDLTRESISEKYDIPVITPETAAHDLLDIALKHDFCLFEYFMTDRIGHRRNRPLAPKYLDEFSRFFLELNAELSSEIGLVLTSDHGNCEDMSTGTHTRNPVPLFVRGLQLPKPDTLKDITNVHDWLFSLFS